ncbi:VOC family protein [Labilibaculum manganireducens]|uniref:VOC family protein n=1 Tax=Labilibaculum manganireducens TaxID=1940525 RepID=UPI0029F5B001|nr:VOC family protein [Labilibaculum manganireducens]
MQKLISWVEIPSVDFDRAVKFYNTVFKLNLPKVDFGQEKMACFPNDEGAISYAPNFKPSENGVMVSFTAPDNIETTIQRIETNGGKVLQPKTKIEVEGRDYFAICIDIEGNKIGIYGK